MYPGRTIPEIVAVFQGGRRHPSAGHVSLEKRKDMLVIS